MAYTSAIYYCDPINGSDTARTALTTCVASNPSGSVTRINKTAHGLVTGAIVDLTLFTAWLNNVWKITVVDADNFDLDTAVWQATADASGTVTPRGGSSKADAWKTHNRGGSNIKALDTIRVIASPDPTLVGNATWTNDSRTVTLAAAKTLEITDCETAWTASANVTATAPTTQPKVGTRHASIAIAGAFTTGKLAYFPIGSTLDLSTYQQVSFWVASASLNTGVLSLRLCSDTTGDVTVDTIAIPATSTSSNWHSAVVDKAAALGSAIQSIALYADTDPGAVTVLLDNIVACKASASADAITHNTIIGKEHNLPWVASTVYTSNAIRKPTPSNRNGYCYKVTAGGGGSSGGTEPTWPRVIGSTVTDGALTWTCLEVEQTWYAIAGLQGTTLLLDGGVASISTTDVAYAGVTESVATYKRDCLLPTLGTAFSATSVLGGVNTSGTDINGVITLSGGWDLTNMNTLNGETWMNLRNGCGSAFSSANFSFWDVRNLSTVRANSHNINQTVGWRFMRFFNCHGNNSNSDSFNHNLSSMTYFENVRADCCAGAGFRLGTHSTGRAITACGNNSNPYGNIILPDRTCKFRDMKALNGQSWGVSGAGGSSTILDCEITDLITAGNGSAGIDFGNATPAVEISLINPNITDVTPFGFGSTQASMLECTIQGLNGDATDNRTYINGSSIRSVTDQRHTASGLAWKFLPISTSDFNGNNIRRPLKLTVAKIACAASVAVNVQIWTRRDNTNIKGYLQIRGGQITGVGEDITVTCEPTINTWVQSGTLTFTPTVAGVVEVDFCVYDGVDSVNSYWIDDLSIT